VHVFTARSKEYAGAFTTDEGMTIAKTAFLDMSPFFEVPAKAAGKPGSDFTRGGAFNGA
jgi:hypothetical protein